MIKTRTTGDFLNIVKNTYKKRTANIMLNGKKLDAAPVR